MIGEHSNMGDASKPMKALGIHYSAVCFQEKTVRARENQLNWVGPERQRIVREFYG